ncbi:hypothetical protein M405DRAFT_830095 [Rhizopogon salebrosus TDB-379]|nr:hypothetical protein M405DRAFT_830095 [Rhizopogon salebrosus TDB-379]
MWTQQKIISILIIGATTFGMLCHVSAIVASLISPDCPFQTPVSLTIRVVFDYFCPSAGCHQDRDKDSTTSSTPPASTASTPTVSDTTSAMQWILETSTNSDVLRSVVELLPTMPEQPSINIMSLCTQIRDMFKACFDQRGIPIFEDDALAYGKALFYFSSKYSAAKEMLRQSTQKWNIWERWHIYYLRHVLEEGRISCHRMLNTGNATSKLQFQADTRTALRMAVAGGIYEFAHPNDERLVRDSQFQMRAPLLAGQFDWLMACAQHFYTTNDIDVAGDALLLCIGVLKETSSIDQNFITAFFRTTPSSNSNLDEGQSLRRFRQITLRAAFWALSCSGALPCSDDLSHGVLRTIMQDECPKEGFQATHAIRLLGLQTWPEDSHLIFCPLPEIQLLLLLVSPAPNVNNTAVYTAYFRALIHFMGVDQSSSFRRAALGIVNRAKHNLATITAPGVDVSLRDMILPELSRALLIAAFHGGSEDRSFHLNIYLQIIFTLVKGPDWLPILIEDGHIERCITLIGIGLDYDSAFYLAGILFSIQVASPEQAASCSAITNEQWWELTVEAWYSIHSYEGQYKYRDDSVEILASLVKGTEMHMPGPQRLVQNHFEMLNLDRLFGTPTRSGPNANVISTIIALKNLIHHKLHGVVEEVSTAPDSPALSVLPHGRTERGNEVRWGNV